MLYRWRIPRLFGYGIYASERDAEKRVLLHNDVDIINELNRITAEIQTLQNTAAANTQRLKEKDTVIEALTSGVENLTRRLDAKDKEISVISAQVGSSTYTRWGRTVCPGNGSSVVYTGYMAGVSLDAHTGEGSNYVCLSDDPIWDHYQEGQGNDIYLSGVEYVFTPHQNTVSLSQFFGNNIAGGEAPCAVCKVVRGASVMIPGRKDCYPGWTKEYSGYIVGGYPGYGDSAEIVCLDRRPEVLLDDGKYQGENSLYFVEAHCSNGGLACPPYVHGRELPCVVCSN